MTAPSSAPTGAAGAAAKKFYFYYGHRKPSHNRPVVYGGLFTNRTTYPSTTNSRPPRRRPPHSTPAVDFRNWDPDRPSPPSTSDALPTFFSTVRSLSPIARYICDSLRRHQRWSPAVLSDLNKLRRVTPELVAEVLKVQSDPALSSRFFHWAGKQKGYHHSYAAYNALAYCLNRSRQPRAADQVIELMHSQGKVPSEKQFEILIRMHADAGRGLRVHHVYNKMKKFGVKPRVFLYNRIMDALVRTGHMELALSVYRDFKEDGLKEESITFMILAKGLCKEGRIHQVLDLLERMRRELCKPDVFAYTAMVKVLVGEGDLDGCLRVWEEMERDSVEPDVMAYTTLVSALCNGGRVVKGYEIFGKMKEKGLLIDRGVYRALVDGFVAVGKVGTGCDLLKEMMQNGYRADLGIYDSLIGGLCCVGRGDKASKLLQFVIQEGLIPGFQTVNPMLVLYADNGDMGRFFELVERMGNLGMPVMDHLTKFFSFFVGKEERTLKALEVSEALKEDKYSCVSIYNVLIEALYKIKELKRALSLFEELKGLKDFQPDSLTYSLIIPCFVDDGDMTEACLCYNKMTEMSWTPSVAAYCSLVKGLCRIGEINAAITVVKDCLGNVTSGPMEFKYTLTILHACKSHEIEKIVGVVDEMIEQGIPLEDILYCAIIHGYCVHGSSEDARKVFALMRKRNLITEAKLIFYEDLLDEHLKRTTAGLVLSGLKFFGLESKLNLTSSLAYPR